MLNFNGSVAMWSGLVGAGLPAIIAILQSEHWPSQLKAALAFLICAVAAAGTAYFAGQLNGSDYVTALLTILTAALGSFHAIWKPSGITASLSRLTGGQPAAPPAPVPPASQV